MSSRMFWGPFVPSSMGALWALTSVLPGAVYDAFTNDAHIDDACIDNDFFFVPHKQVDSRSRILNRKVLVSVTINLLLWKILTITEIIVNHDYYFLGPINDNDDARQG